jgi:hypothetical protein
MRRGEQIRTLRGKAHRGWGGGRGEETMVAGEAGLRQECK